MKKYRLCLRQARYFPGFILCALMFFAFTDSGAQRINAFRLNVRVQDGLRSNSELRIMIEDTKGGEEYLSIRGGISDNSQKQVEKVLHTSVNMEKIHRVRVNLLGGGLSGFEAGFDQGDAISFIRLSLSAIYADGRVANLFETGAIPSLKSRDWWQSPIINKRVLPRSARAQLLYVTVLTGPDDLRLNFTQQVPNSSYFKMTLISDSGKKYGNGTPMLQATDLFQNTEEEFENITSRNSSYRWMPLNAYPASDENRDEMVSIIRGFAIRGNESSFIAHSEKTGCHWLTRAMPLLHFRKLKMLFVPGRSSRVSEQAKWPAVQSDQWDFEGIIVTARDPVTGNMYRIYSDIQRRRFDVQKGIEFNFADQNQFGLAITTVAPATPLRY